MANAVSKDSFFEFSSPVSLRYGKGLIDRLSEFVPAVDRALLVTGKDSAIRSGLVDRVRAGLPETQIELFSGVEPNPSIRTVEKGAALARETGAQLVVGLGGGSAMDAAKVIAALTANDGGFYEHFQKPEFPVPPLPVAAIPTTCGTGSEANKYAIITDTEKDDKVNFSNRSTYPVIGILDPSVLAEIPLQLLSFTACDAFCHAFEGFISRRSTPPSDTVALDAMGLIIGNLPSAVSGDMTARGNLLYASALAGIVIDHAGTTVLHALGYYLTLRHGVPHGEANALLLPLLFDYLDSVCPDKMAAVYELFPPEMTGVSGLKQYLGTVGIDAAELACVLPADEFEGIIEYTLGKKNTPLTPGNLDREVLLNLLQSHAI